MSVTQPAGALTVLAKGALLDMAVSPAGNLVYVSDSAGTITAYNYATGAKAAQWQVGVKLGGMDVSLDGRYLYVVEQDRDFNNTGPVNLTVHQVDTVTGAVKDFTKRSASGEGPLYDVAVLADGGLLLSQSYGLTWMPLISLNLSTGLFTSGTDQFYNAPKLTADASHTQVIVAPGALPRAIYTSGVGITGKHDIGQENGPGSLSGIQAISTSAHLVAIGANIYTDTLRYMYGVGSKQPQYFVITGEAFSADGKHLYIFDLYQGRIFDLSTSTWAIERVLPTGFDIPLNYSPYEIMTGDRLSLAPDGHHLLVMGDGVLSSVDLLTTTPYGGTDGAEALVGGVGADTLYSYGGADFLDGGEGDDKLYGGPGDDRLIGGGGNDVIDGGDGTDVADYAAASAGVRIDLSYLYSQETGGAGNDTLNGVENLVGSAFGDILLGDAKANVLDGGVGDDILRGGDSSDTLRGGAGNDILSGDVGDDLLDGGDGVDIVSYDSAILGVTVDLTKTGLQNTRGGGLDTLVGIEGVTGSKFADTLSGDGRANILFGGAGDDQISGGAGDDLLAGGEGDDRIDGGDGFDTVRVIGRASDFEVVKNADGTTTVTDLRAGSPQGRDTLTSIEAITFEALQTTQQISNQVNWLLRLYSQSALTTQLYQGWLSGQLTGDQVMGRIMALTDATTSVATLSYQFFTGKIPTQAGVDYLVSDYSSNTNTLNSAYYAQFDTVNRYINFSVNLGKNGEGKAAFAAKYGSLSLFDATKKAYAEIFGGAPTDAKVHSLIDARVDYLAYYGGDGATGIGTKAAMVGFLLAAAATENVGVMARSNDAWLADLSDGSAPFSVNILDPAKGYYKADFIFGG